MSMFPYIYSIRNPVHCCPFLIFSRQSAEEYYSLLFYYRYNNYPNMHVPERKQLHGVEFRNNYICALLYNSIGQPDQ